MIIKLAWRNIVFKPLNTFLSILLLTSSITIMTLLILLEKQFEEQFSSNADDIDLVLGAQGSPLQLVLSSVYQIDTPTGNINYDSAKVWMKHPFVQKAIPLAFGDNYDSYKIVGTTGDYLKKFDAQFIEGKEFLADFEVVVGSTVAQKKNLKIGSTFYSIHGDAKEGEKHETKPFKVVGVLQPTGKMIDNLIMCSIKSVWNVHEEISDEEHHYNHSREITSVLLKFRNKMAIMMWPRIIASNTKMQAVSPAIEINRLFTLFGVGIKALSYLGYGIMLISGLSIFIMLYNRLKERKYEFALLRLQGATKNQLILLVLLESIFLCIVGFCFGTIIGRFALQIISKLSEEDLKMIFDPFEVIWEKEGALLSVTLLLGVISALIPAFKAYKMNLSKTLANA
ncbi:permease [Flavobacterium covae]|uniref:ABC transporter permease n=1 Tax=Flavobacterium TaxID=237 RepID=UPI0007C1CAF7|nr:FtsX-like permease family protein [Flavobacterium covae]AND64544.1 permease [Flavobacterium covae]MCJ1807351.1 FtsX-like permease family protein [Flavobacterium covae]OXA82348.1 permease [Flavobacterium columnare] [Flavobacterium columnare NBRC 100251 = ATCC 23463]